MQVKRWMRIGAALLAATVLPAMTTAAATAHFQKSFPAQGVSAVRVDVSFHDVEVVVKQTPNVEITVDLEARGSKSKAEKLLAEYTPKFKVEDGRIQVRSVRKHGSWWFGRRSIRGKVTVAMPPGLNVDLDTSSGDCNVEGDLGKGSIMADTSSGDFKLSGAAQRISADTSSGDVSVTGRAGKIVADTSSGDVELRLDQPADDISVDTSSGDVSLAGGAARFAADTSSGDVQASGLTGSAKADTSSGDVTLSWSEVRAGTEVKIGTTSGEVRLELPKDTLVEGRASTTSGTIRSDFGGRTEKRGHLLILEAADAEASLTVATTSGDVTLRKR